MPAEIVIDCRDAEQVEIARLRALLRRIEPQLVRATCNHMAPDRGTCEALLAELRKELKGEA